MPESNIDRHRRSVAGFNTRDVEAFVAFCDPEIELHSAVTAAGGAVYHGHGGVREWHRDLADGFGDEVRVEPEAYFDVGEHTVTFHVLRGRGRQSGADVAMPAAHVCRWRDGLIVYFKGYARREDVPGDLGISADELEPLAP
jgi:ketosteroid isomerase-like protein